MKSYNTLRKLSYKSVTLTLYHKTCVLYQISLSTIHVVYYGMLTIQESNTQFPVTKQYFRMMRDKDILQLFFESLNNTLSSPLHNGYHHISSVTVSSSNRH